jgi:hypothetical protein
MSYKSKFWAYEQWFLEYFESGWIFWSDSGWNFYISFWVRAPDFTLDFSKDTVPSEKFIKKSHFFLLNFRKAIDYSWALPEAGIGKVCIPNSIYSPSWKGSLNLIESKISQALVQSQILYSLEFLWEFFWETK